MILCGYPGIQFRCKDILCILNDRFCIVLFTNSTVLSGGVLSPLGFVIPTKFLSFIKTISPKYSYDTRLSSIFTFADPRDEERLREYVDAQRLDKDYEIILDLKPALSRSSKSQAPSSLKFKRSHKCI